MQVQPDRGRLSRRLVYVCLRVPLDRRLRGSPRAFHAQPGEILQDRRPLKGCALLCKRSHMQATRVMRLCG